jgi:hypothetical protein
MKTKNFEGLELGVRDDLAKILCQESNIYDGSSILVSFFILCLVACHIPNHFGDFWPIPAHGIKEQWSNIFELLEMLQDCLGME